MKKMKQNAYLSILLVFAVTALEICIKEITPKIPIHIEKVCSFLENKGVYTGRDVCDLKRTPAVIYQKIDEDFRQCRGRRQRKISGGLPVLSLALTGCFARLPCYAVNNLHKHSTAAAYCRSIIIRYIHHQDGRPPAHLHKLFSKFLT